VLKKDVIKPYEEVGVKLHAFLASALSIDEFTVE
jgi:hypothetical protein